jgi:hypothetical protein
MKRYLAVVLAASTMQAAEIPVTKVVIYKNGVAYYERSGAVKAGEPAKLEFKASEMDDVLKSLLVEDRGGAISRVRYEPSEPLERKLDEAGIQFNPQQPLVLLLDQWRGARLNLKYRGEPVSGSIVSGRLAPLPNQGQKQELVMLLDSGELKLVDLDAATGLEFADPQMQKQLVTALTWVVQARSKERRALYVDTAGSSGGNLTARYLLPAPVWKSSYRLSLPEGADAFLEGWAIIDNMSGQDWSNVDLTVVSGRPVSFISQLYEPRYVQRSVAGLPDEQAAAPVLYEGALQGADEKNEVKDRLEKSKAGSGGGFGGGAFKIAGQMRAASEMVSMNAAAAPPVPMMSAVAMSAQAREAGELFEYRFSNPVYAKNGESILLPFVQQKVGARKLLVYSAHGGANPRNAVEITNTTGKALDGGPITVYQAGGYAGEALFDTLKGGDKRLISYSVDQGARVTTNFESGASVVRSIRAQRGVLTTKTAVETTTTYTIDNSEAKEKTLLVEQAVVPGQKVVSPKPDETTPGQYRFSVKLAPKSVQKLPVVEEREIESSAMVISMTPDVLVAYTQNKALPATAKAQLSAILAKKNAVAEADRGLKQVEQDMNEINRDQERLRQNINSLNRVAGQQEQVNRYAADLAKSDAALAQFRDRQAELRKRHNALETELIAMIEKLEF